MCAEVMCVLVLRLTVLFTIFLQFRSLCDAKIFIINKQTKELVYTVNEEFFKGAGGLLNCDFCNTKTYLVNAEPVDACNNVKAPPKTEIVDVRKSTQDKAITWILLAQNDGCDLNEKIENAKLLGYKYIFLYGDLNKKYINASGADLPTYFISKNDGTNLKNYTHPKRFYVTPIPSSSWFAPLIDFCDLIIRVILLIVTHWSVQCLLYGLPLSIFFCWSMGYEFGYPGRGFYDDDSYYEAFNQLGGRITNGDGQRLLNQIISSSILTEDQHNLRLPSITWTPTEGSEEICVICHDVFTPNESLTTLPCNHYFHKQCIMTWLKERRQCPVCRNPVVTNEHRNQLEQLVREYIRSEDWIQERNDQLRETCKDEDHQIKFH